MPYTAVIVESPAKCAKIEKFLGPGYKCMASYGHIRTLNSLDQININNNFTPKFINISGKNQQITKLKSFVAGANDVMLAADDDREGEAIAWHVCKITGLPVDSTKRIIFHEITEPALKAAVANPTRINMELVRAQQARQILDLVVGFKVSPVLWSNLSFNTKTALSAGRCQTPALRLIYDNQKEIDSSPGRKVYNTTGYFTSKNLPFSLSHNHEGEEAMGDFLEESASWDHEYSCGDVRKTTKNPPSPFTTSGLQQSASTELRLTPKQTMDACQKLYEAGYITYMRTDSKTYSPEFIATAKEWIIKQYGDKYVHPEIESLSERSEDKKKSKKKSKKKEESTAQEAHEAIRPTKVSVEEVDQSQDNIGNREARVYALIRRNTLESCMAAATYNGVTAKITAPESHCYKYSTEQVIFPGWKVVAGYEETNPVFTYLQTLKEGILAYNSITSKVTMKDLKNHYTEAKLVQLLEQNGIGRPSTFASLVDKIQERKYVIKQNVTGKKIDCTDFELKGEEITETTTNREFGGEKGKLVIQQLGTVVMEFLAQHFDTLFAYDYTKIMEDELDQIAKGESIWHELCRSCYNQIEELSSGLTQKSGKGKEVIEIDEHHTYMIAKYGPVIKCTTGKKTTFKKVKTDIDLDKLRRGEYTLAEIVETKASASSGRNLGKKNGNDVILKKGRYGLYVEWGTSKINISAIDAKEYETVELAALNEYLVKPVLLEISKEASIRNGKYGPYIYYKTSKMKKPRFISLDDSIAPNCTAQDAKDWLLEKHQIEL
tara:strand:- start:1574 stop:3904 length:2331 start_codon:yes stop_codon:yes gene_type:complete